MIFVTGRDAGADSRWRCGDGFSDNDYTPEGANKWQGGNEFRHKDHNPTDNKRFVPYVQKVEMDPETHPEMVVMMEKCMSKFKGVHLNKVLGCQGKAFKDLPMLNDHMDNI